MSEENVDAKTQAREAYDRRKSDQIRDLKAKLAELESKLTEQTWALNDDTDPRIRALIQQQKQSQEELEYLMRVALKSPDDDELGEYMDRVMDEHGDEMRKMYPNRIKRLEAVRVMARGLRSEEEGDKTHVPTGRKDSSLSRVHLTGGGPSAQRTSKSEEQALADLQVKMRSAKSSEERERLLAEYRAKYPS